MSFFFSSFLALLLLDISRFSFSVFSLLDSLPFFLLLRERDYLFPANGLRVAKRFYPIQYQVFPPFLTPFSLPPFFFTFPPVYNEMSFAQTLTLLFIIARRLTQSPFQLTMEGAFFPLSKGWLWVTPSFFFSWDWTILLFFIWVSTDSFARRCRCLLHQARI